MLNLLFFLFLTGSLACQEERSRFDRAVAVGLEDAFPILYPHCSDTCADLWTNIRAAVPDPCDERCWEDVQEGFLRRHAACKGTVERSCARRLGPDCVGECRADFLGQNEDCRAAFSASCEEKRRWQDWEEGFTKTYPECSECGLKRAGALAVYQGTGFEAAFGEAFPECAKAVVRRRLGTSSPRYDLCGIGTSGNYTIEKNCSITSTVVIAGTLQILGQIDANGARPAIDGGWDGVKGSNTGVRLFSVGNGDELIITDIILTHGQVSIGCSVVLGCV